MSRRIAAVVVLAGALVAPSASVAQGGHDHGGGEGATPQPGQPVGVLLADHGEPPVYDEDTYWSFRDFVDHLMGLGIIPPELRVLDTGTVLQDAGCPACPQPRANPRLVDAWLRTHSGPALFVPASERLPAHYVLPGGPGLGEPDVFEHGGHQTWEEWRRMGGRSPNHDEKIGRNETVAERLSEDYGDRVAVRFGYVIDPRIGGSRQGIREAVERLVRRDRVGSIVVAYLGVGFSDVMQTHHLRHHLTETLEELGAGDIPVRYAQPLGTTDAYVDAVVEKAQAELDAAPAGSKVAIHLSGHGLPTAACGRYDCGADAYHEHSAALFARAREAIARRVRHGGEWGLFHVYGEGGDSEADPADEVDSPLEALATRKAEGYTHVVDIPYEFDANSRDTLIVLRRGYGRTAPDWDAALESAFEHDGLQVRITNANWGEPQKLAARETVVRSALTGLAEPRPLPRRATVGVHDNHFHPATARIRRGGTVTWRWQGHHPHDVRFRRGRSASPVRTTGSWRRRFRLTGRYAYVCTLHEGMTGEVVVR